VRNQACQKVLEKEGFKREGILLKSAFARGEWRDYYLTASSERNEKNRRY
jgi:RimJ/RimL family protein N-acetyltransferase